MRRLGPTTGPQVESTGDGRAGRPQDFPNVDKNVGQLVEKPLSRAEAAP